MLEIGERKPTLTVDASVVRGLMDVGAVAVNNGLFPEAETIFDAVAAARPVANYAAYGQALVELARGRHDEAARILRPVVSADDEIRQQAEGLLAMALQLGGRMSEFEKLCSSSDNALLKQVRDALQD